jgi:hypothetical protein
MNEIEARFRELMEWINRDISVKENPIHIAKRNELGSMNT